MSGNITEYNRAIAISISSKDIDIDIARAIEEQNSDSEILEKSAEAVPGQRTADTALQPAAVAGQLVGELPTLEELQKVVERHKVNLSPDGVVAFYTEVTSAGGMLYGKPIERKHIVRALRGWAKYHDEYHRQPAEELSEDAPGEPAEDQTGREDQEERTETENPMINLSFLEHAKDIPKPFREQAERMGIELKTLIVWFTSEEAYTPAEMEYIQQELHMKPGRQNYWKERDSLEDALNVFQWDVMSESERRNKASGCFDSFRKAERGKNNDDAIINHAVDCFAAVYKLPPETAREYILAAAEAIRGAD